MAQFIKVTGVDGEVRWLNIDSISSISRNGDGSLLLGEGGKQLAVQESTSEIVLMLNTDRVRA